MKKTDLTDATIREYARQLRLPTFNHYKEIIADLKTNDGYGEFLAQQMATEIHAREEKSKQRRITSARFPYLKTFEELELDRIENVDNAFLNELSTCRFIDERKNLVLIGNPGTGKTHLMIALGILACQKGYSVRFIRVGDLIDTMHEAREEKKLMSYMKQLSKVDLLLMDEWGYTQLTREQSDLLFKVISDRSELHSIIVTTNYRFAEWEMFFADPTLVTAIVGRLTFRSHVLNMNSEHPYREDYSVLPNHVSQKIENKE